jgi:hypothetical protein
MSHSREEQFRSALLGWVEENLRDFAWRKTDRSLYKVFVAEFFLTQTPAEDVADVYPKFLERFQDLGSPGTGTHSPRNRSSARERCLRIVVSASFGMLKRQPKAV